jgi:hypothetical protein
MRCAVVNSSSDDEEASESSSESSSEESSSDSSAVGIVVATFGLLGCGSLAMGLDVARVGCGVSDEAPPLPVQDIHTEHFNNK